MTAYWLGVLTIPALVFVASLLFISWIWATEELRRHGITFEARWRRNTDRISDYTLRHDIWWERPFGPVFAGGWYREQPVYDAPSRARFNRWIGIGRTDGPNLMVFHSRDLGEVSSCQ